MNKRNALKIAASGVLLTLGIGLLGGCSETKPQFRGVDITGADYARDLRLLDHNGQVRSLQDFKGKVVIVFFGYTQCPDVCPTSMAELAEVKFAIRHGLGAGGVMILNADDPPVVVEAERLGLRAAWFSLDEGAPQVRAARSEGRLVGFVRDGAIWLQDGDRAERIIAVEDIPITMGGAARYNILNALGAA